MNDRQTTAPLSNYWSVGVPDFVPAQSPLQNDYDVVVIGAGYTGLAVACGLARQGLSVLVLEEKTVGYGASSRNGGMVGPSFHELGMVGLTRKYGEDKAQKIMRAGMDALDYCQDLFTNEDINCAFSLSGRFRGARSEVHLKAMIAECERLKAAVGLPYEVVASSKLPDHTGSLAYKGGIIYPRDGGLHPKRLVNSLAARAQAAGAVIRTGTPVNGIEPDGNRFLVATPSATLKSRQVVIATDGYSDRRVFAMNERIVPIDVTVCATRRLGEDSIRAMSPRFHVHGESGRVFIWSRPSPDRTRFIFGGRISTPSAPAHVQQRQISTAISRLYPDLAPEDFEHIWHGKVGYTTDHAPHLNKVDGIWLIGGYCGSGVTRSLFFADRLVRKMTGQPGSQTPFDDLEFPRVPFRLFAPLGAKILTRYYGWLDNRDAGKAMRNQD
jgi:glycine/D-amino acid oxidase-like deaminating enzyme